jgi:purine-binding chemotaxis protein CheW
MEKVNSKNVQDEMVRYLEFSLGKLDYAIPLLMVREVITVPETTTIPKSPAFFLGIMNLRGQIISVVDLRKKLNITDKNDDLEEAVIILDIGQVNIGVVVDSINKVLTFKASEIAPAPEVDLLIKSDYVGGVYRKEHSLTVILEVNKIFDVNQLQAIQKVA